MNLKVPHTVLVISANRIRVDWLKPARILGPGVYHFEGDLRPRLRTLSQTKAVARGFIEVRFGSGDTVAVLKELLKEADGNQDRLNFIYGLAGRAGVDLGGNVAVAPVANLETGETPDGDPLNVADAEKAPLTSEADLHAAAEKAAAAEQAQTAALAAAEKAAEIAAEDRSAGLSPSGDDEEIVVSDADAAGTTIDLKEIGTASIAKK